MTPNMNKYSASSRMLYSQREDHSSSMRGGGLLLTSSTSSSLLEAGGDAFRKMDFLGLLQLQDLCRDSLLPFLDVREWAPLAKTCRAGRAMVINEDDAKSCGSTVILPVVGETGALLSAAALKGIQNGQIKILIADFSIMAPRHVADMHWLLMLNNLTTLDLRVTCDASENYPMLAASIYDMASLRNLAVTGNLACTPIQLTRKQKRDAEDRRFVLESLVIAPNRRSYVVSVFIPGEDILTQTAKTEHGRIRSLEADSLIELLVPAKREDCVLRCLEFEAFGWIDDVVAKAQHDRGGPIDPLAQLSSVARAFLQRTLPHLRTLAVTCCFSPYVNMLEFFDFLKHHTDKSNNNKQVRTNISNNNNNMQSPSLSCINSTSGGGSDVEDQHINNNIKTATSTNHLLISSADMNSVGAGATSCNNSSHQGGSTTSCRESHSTTRKVNTNINMKKLCLRLNLMGRIEREDVPFDRSDRSQRGDEALRSTFIHDFLREHLTEIVFDGGSFLSNCVSFKVWAELLNVVRKTKKCWFSKLTVGDSRLMSSLYWSLKCSSCRLDMPDWQWLEACAIAAHEEEGCERSKRHVFLER